MPLLFNWQSASFSVPSLIGILAPLNWAFTVQVVVTLIISGSGAYALGRVLDWSTVACVFAGTVFELSGPMVGWLGWPLASVMSWAGWLFAATVLILETGASARRVTGLAVVVAAMIYAGHPEGLTLFVGTLVLFTVVYLVREHAISPNRSYPRNPIAGVAVGAGAGLALGAPLLLPGLQVISRSVHNSPGVNAAELVKGNPPLPAGTLVHLLLQGYDGLPVAASHWFGYAGGYSETAAYLGVIPLVLAVLALATRGRRPEVGAMAVVAVVTAMMAFLPPLVAALGALPLVGNLVWQRALLPATFALTVLAGVGMDCLVRAPLQIAVRHWLTRALIGVVVLLSGLWVFGQGGLPAAEASIRRSSFLWAAVEVAVGVAVVGALYWAARPSRPLNVAGGVSPVRLGLWAGAALLVCETAFLIFAGAPLWTASSAPYAPTSSTVALHHAVGSSVVGFGAPLCFFPPGLGITPNAQVAYGIHELGAYDPLLPDTYYTSWKALTGEPAGSPSLATYCPAITTVDQARLYGVSFVLEPAGTPGPQGTRRYATIGGEGLYQVPGAAAATLIAVPGSGTSADKSPPPVAVAVHHPNPAAWSMVTTSSQAGALRLRLTDVPGWHATVDGHPVPVTGFAGVMLQVAVPAGRHRVELHYWPTAFTIGLVLAGLAVVGLLTACALKLTPRRSSAEPGAGTRSEGRAAAVRRKPTPASAGDP